MLRALSEDSTAKPFMRLRPDIDFEITDVLSPKPPEKVNTLSNFLRAMLWPNKHYEHRVIQLIRQGTQSADSEVLNIIDKTFFDCCSTQITFKYIYGAKKEEIAYYRLLNFALLHGRETIASNILDDEGERAVDGTALLDACTAGASLEIIGRILSYSRVDVNKKTGCLSVSSLRTTALSIAAKLGNLELVKFLLSKGAEPDITDKRNVPKESDYKTPLIMAAKYGRTEIAEQLLLAGADVSTEYVKWSRFGKKRKERDRNALYFAVENNHLDTLQVLLKHTKDNYRLSKAIVLAKEKGYTEILKALENRGSEITRMHKHEAALRKNKHDGIASKEKSIPVSYQPAYRCGAGAQSSPVQKTKTASERKDKEINTSISIEKDGKTVSIDFLGYIIRNNVSTINPKQEYLNDRLSINMLNGYITPAVVDSVNKLAKYCLLSEKFLISIGTGSGPTESFLMSLGIKVIRIEADGYIEGNMDSINFGGAKLFDVTNHIAYIPPETGSPYYEVSTEAIKRALRIEDEECFYRGYDGERKLPLPAEYRVDIDAYFSKILQQICFDAGVDLAKDSSNAVFFCSYPHWNSPMAYYYLSAMRSGVSDYLFRLDNGQLSFEEKLGSCEHSSTPIVPTPYDLVNLLYNIKESCKGQMSCIGMEAFAADAGFEIPEEDHGNIDEIIERCIEHFRSRGGHIVKVDASTVRGLYKESPVPSCSDPLRNRTTY